MSSAYYMNVELPEMILGAESPRQPIVCIRTSLRVPAVRVFGNALAAPIRERFARSHRAPLPLREATIFRVMAAQFRLRRYAPPVK